MKTEAFPTPIAASTGDIQPNVETLAHFKKQLANHAALDNWIHIDGDQAIGVLEQGRFASRFSRLVRLSAHADHGGVIQEDIGWRANLLAYDRTAILVSSAAMFASIRQSTLLISLDRMTRAMHSINFFSSQVQGLLFLPVHEGLLLNVRHDHGQYFASLLLSLRLNPAKVVIEIPAVFATQTTLLSKLIASYHRYGFKVALNLPDGVDLKTLPPSSKPEFLLTEIDIALAVDQSAGNAAPAAMTPTDRATLGTLLRFARGYGAAIVARAAA